MIFCQSVQEIACLEPKLGLGSILLQLPQFAKYHNIEFNAMLHKLVTAFLNKPQGI